MILRKNEINCLSTEWSQRIFFKLMPKKRVIFYAFLSTCILSQCAGAVLEKGGHTRNSHLTQQATIIRNSQYKILETSSGESSTLFLFGLFPVTSPLDIEYAMSQAVQKIPGGQSLIDIHYWHETHVFFPLGTVSVLTVEGKVISYESDISELDKSLKKVPPR